jgi:hypothetical protein
MSASYRKMLMAVSATHLVVAVVSMRVAMARRSPFHLPILHGDPNRMARDSLGMGTALSEPVVMMVTEVWALTMLARRASPGAVAVLGWLGASNVPGYLLEQQVRTRLRPRGWDRVESSLAVGGLVLSAAMATLAATQMRARSGGSVPG